MELSEVAFAHIKDDYWFAKYFDMYVTIRKEDGYINASRLCKYAGKQLKNWKRNKSSIVMVAAFEKAHTTPLSFLQKVTTMKDTNENKFISGTYAHPLLIPHIASWASYDFALKVSKIVNEYLVLEYRAKITAIEQQNTLLLNENLNLENLVDNGNKQISLLESIGKNVGQQLQLAQAKLTLRKWSGTRAFLLASTNDSSAKKPYYIIQCKRRGLKPARNKLVWRHPNAIVVFLHHMIPGNVNMLQRLRDDKHIRCKGNYCEQTAATCEQFFAIVRQIVSSEIKASFARQCVWVHFNNSHISQFVFLTLVVIS